MHIVIVDDEPKDPKRTFKTFKCACWLGSYGAEEAKEALKFN